MTGSRQANRRPDDARSTAASFRQAPRAPPDRGADRRIPGRPHQFRRGRDGRHGRLVLCNPPRRRRPRHRLSRGRAGADGRQRPRRRAGDAGGARVHPARRYRGRDQRRPPGLRRGGRPGHRRRAKQRRGGFCQRWPAARLCRHRRRRPAGLVHRPDPGLAVQDRPRPHRPPDPDRRPAGRDRRHRRGGFRRRGDRRSTGSPRCWNAWNVSKSWKPRATPRSPPGCACLRPRARSSTATAPGSRTSRPVPAAPGSAPPPPEQPGSRAGTALGPAGPAPRSQGTSPPSRARSAPPTRARCARPARPN